MRELSPKELKQFKKIKKFRDDTEKSLVTLDSAIATASTPKRKKEFIALRDSTEIKLKKVNREIKIFEKVYGLRN